MLCRRSCARRRSPQRGRRSLRSDARARLCLAAWLTADIRTSTQILDFRGFDSIRIFIIRGGIPRPIREYPAKFESTNLNLETHCMETGRTGRFSRLPVCSRATLRRSASGFAWLGLCRLSPSDLVYHSIKCWSIC